MRETAILSADLIESDCQLQRSFEYPSKAWTAGDHLGLTLTSIFLRSRVIRVLKCATPQVSNYLLQNVQGFLIEADIDNIASASSEQSLATFKFKRLRSARTDFDQPKAKKEFFQTSQAIVSHATLIRFVI